MCPAALPTVEFGPEVCQSLAEATTREWLETDGLGGYASSTVAGIPTRRYHGLLVARPTGSSKRHVFLARLEEHARLGEEVFALSAARHASGVAPEGFRGPERFELCPWPRSTYAVGDVGDARLVREVQLVRGAPTVLVRYRVEGGQPLELELHPLLAFREADALTVENDVLAGEVEPLDGGVRVRPYDSLPTISLTVGGADCAFTAAPRWLNGLEYTAELERGYPGHEDQFSPGSFRARLASGDELVLAATVAEPVAEPRAAWRRASEARLARCGRIAAGPATRAPADTRVAFRADDFLYKDASGRTGITAGFPWFGEWGRDTFIALPGLTLARDDREGCEEVLSGALEYLQDGLLPNIYGTSREDSHYGSADASLWFARAVRLWEADGGGRRKLHDEYLPALLEITEAYHSGTELGIRADEDELVRMGTPELNPTWMDANASGGAVTPRDGFPVELNALWYSLLAHVERLLADGGAKADARRLGDRRRKARRAFLERFWLADEDYLADGWKDGVTDRSVRPNMVIAAALEESPLTRKERRGIVERAAAELLTPRGLRTLSPHDPAYRGRYAGGPDERDAAYHQGTVWPWLLGFYTEARLRAYGGTRAESDALGAMWDGLAEELDHAGLDHLSEVFDGDPPHRPGGTIAQAWNTAEYLRARALLAGWSRSR